jgi:eukaryotic-like serine/threonine-protein kinase
VVDAPRAWSSGDLIAGRYEVTEPLGTGGMSSVFAARRLSDDLAVALKMPHARVEATTASRVLREARAVSRLEGEHIARVLDVDTFEDGSPFLVMELLRGRDLAAVLRADGPLPIERAARYLLDVCEAVGEAHAAGIVHRDIKPSNLFLARDADGGELVKVLDFGLAKALGPAALDDSTLTRSDAVVGSPRYLAPEVVRDGTAVDQRCDVWSLGIVLYELVTGVTPFDAPTACGVLARIVADPAPPIDQRLPGASDALVRLVRRALEKDPARRLQSVEEFARCLAELTPGAGDFDKRERVSDVPAVQRSMVAAAPVRSRAAAARLVFGVALLFALVGGVAQGLLLPHEAPAQPRERAQNSTAGSVASPAVPATATARAAPVPSPPQASNAAARQKKTSPASRPTAKLPAPARRTPDRTIETRK